MTREDTLQQTFLQGTPPKNLNGFYPGRLEQRFPRGFLEALISFGAKFWRPWYGKAFIASQQQGDNIVPGYLSPLIHAIYGDKAILKKEANKLHVLLFTTKIIQGATDPIPVLQLNYDLPGNPWQVRMIVDELVCIGEDKYLGKAYLKTKTGYRLLAFFRLWK